MERHVKTPPRRFCQLLCSRTKGNYSHSSESIDSDQRSHYIHRVCNLLATLQSLRSSCHPSTNIGILVIQKRKGKQMTDDFGAIWWWTSTKTTIPSPCATPPPPYVPYL